MIGAKRTLVSVLVAVLLVTTAILSTWLMASAGVFNPAEQALPGAPATESSTTVAAAAGRSVALNTGFQVSQPRDPFKPLIVPPPEVTTTTTGTGETTSTTGTGETTTTTTGSGSTTTTTVAGSTTTTTVGDDPAGVRVVLLEVRTENGSRVAVVEVDGVTYTVAVGDTFATSFKVVSLTDNGGVFTFGDSAFTLAVGQAILK